MGRVRSDVKNVLVPSPRGPATWPPRTKPRDFKTKYFYLLIEHVLSRTVLCSMTWGEKIEIYGGEVPSL